MGASGSQGSSEQGAAINRMIYPQAKPFLSSSAALGHQPIIITMVRGIRLMITIMVTIIKTIITTTIRITIRIIVPIPITLIMAVAEPAIAEISKSVRRLLLYHQQYLN